MSPDRLVAEEIRAALRPVNLGFEVVVLESTESTNDVVREMAAAGPVREGLVVFAEHQTAGRGQRGNRWESIPYKGLYFSILLRPDLDVRDSGQLTRWGAQGVADTIQGFCELEAAVKPPNDIYVGARKVGGVLVEMRAQPQARHNAIVGVGLNVNQQLPDFPKELQERATSLAIETKKPVERQRLAVALLRNLDRTYRALFRSGAD